MSENAYKKMAVKAYKEEQEMEEKLKTDQKSVKENTKDDEASMKKSIDHDQNAPSKPVEVKDSAGGKSLNTGEEKDDNSLKLLATVASGFAPQQGNLEEQNTQVELGACASGIFKLPEVPAPSTSRRQDPAENPWLPVGFVTGTRYNVENYSATSANTSNITTDNLPEFSNSPRISLEPGTRYRIRIAAVNSCGRSEWSEPSLFKTAVPGFPETPRNIKITKTPHGVKLSWDQPVNTYGPIKEYSVWLAVRGYGNCRDKNQDQFITVYCGANTNCFIPNGLLKTAAIIQSGNDKTETIFRISAKNEKGYGPSTQIRWIQGPNPKP